MAKQNGVHNNGIKITEGDFNTPLPSPPLFDLQNSAAFEAKQTEVEILKGKKTNVYGY